MKQEYLTPMDSDLHPFFSTLAVMVCSAKNARTKSDAMNHHNAMMRRIQTETAKERQSMRHGRSGSATEGCRSIRAVAAAMEGLARSSTSDG
jgi:hypothetical protein